MRRILLLVAVLFTATFAQPQFTPAVAVAGPTSSTSPCIGAPPSPVRHVVWILMENKARSQIVGNPRAPYVNALGRSCGSGANYHAVVHDSLPNYIALTSGSTQGVHDDANPSAHHLTAPSVFSQLSDRGLTWKSYQESMPANCHQTNAGRYAVRHNPAAYYVRIASGCAVADVPYRQLSDDLDANALPTFSFVTPDLCSDMHSCSIATGDTWLENNLSHILDSTAYRSGTTAVMLTWDEGNRTTTNVPLVVIAPSVRSGTTVTTLFHHPQLLNATEQMLGLPALPGASGGSAFRSAFRLP